MSLKALGLGLGGVWNVQLSRQRCRKGPIRRARHLFFFFFSPKKWSSLDHAFFWLMVLLLAQMLLLRSSKVVLFPRFDAFPFVKHVKTVALTSGIFGVLSS